jgi:signal transduction histidine kinase
MSPTGHAPDGTGPAFPGSISRRLTVLLGALFVLFALVAGLTVEGARRIRRVHDELEGLESHLRVLDRLADAVHHLRAEAQDALSARKGLDDPDLRGLPPLVRAAWASFERTHFNEARALSRQPGAEWTLARDLGEGLTRFLDLAQSVFSARREGNAARRRLAAAIHDEAHRIEELVRRLRGLHHVLVAERSLAARDTEARIRWIFGLFLGLGGVTLGAAGLLFVRGVAMPLRRLAAALGLAHGASERKVPVSSRDEIGTLARALNRMGEKPREREAQMGRRARQSEALHRLGVEISGLLDVDRILRAVVEGARSLLGAEAAALCLRQEGSGRLEIAARAGPNLPPADLPQPVSVAGQGGDGLCQGCPEARGARGGSHVSAVLRRGEEPVGVLCVATVAPRAWGETEREWLDGLAAQTVIALENARRYRAVRGLAALEERERLAREMHDGLAQALGFLHLKLGEAERMLRDGTTEPARRALAEMRRVAGDAYDEVRRAIFGLRAMVSRGPGLVPTLAEYLHEFGQQTGLEVKLEVPADDGCLRVAPEVEVQLVRIVQEALHNVRKHAGGRTARVHFRSEGEQLVLVVQDDGVGFDLARSGGDGRRHFGLATMRERAESLGGLLTIQSATGQGTQVVVHVPRAGAARLGGG